MSPIAKTVHVVAAAAAQVVVVVAAAQVVVVVVVAAAAQFLPVVMLTLTNVQNFFQVFICRGYILY